MFPKSMFEVITLGYFRSQTNTKRKRPKLISMYFPLRKGAICRYRIISSPKCTKRTSPTHKKQRTTLTISLTLEN